MDRRPKQTRCARTCLLSIFIGGILPILLASGCAQQAPSTLAPEGPAALAIARLGWILFALGGAVFIAVTAFLFVSLYRRQGRDLQPESRARSDRKIIVGGGIIHSFWVPRLHGKLDLIPGRTTSFWLQADETGEYWGERPTPITSYLPCTAPP